MSFWNQAARSIAKTTRFFTTHLNHSAIRRTFSVRLAVDIHVVHTTGKKRPEGENKNTYKLSIPTSRYPS